MNKLTGLILVAAVVISSVVSQTTDLVNFTGQCRTCICNIESGCRPLACAMDAGSLSCGYYQIKEPYWIDCGRPGGGWQSCSLDKKCSDLCIDAYLRRYGYYCTKKLAPSCIEFGRIHNGGPLGCQKTATDPYAAKLDSCMKSGK